MIANAFDDITESPPPSPDDYNALRRWIQELVDLRRGTHALLLHMEPFAPFDVQKAMHLRAVIDQVAATAADAIESGAAPTIRLEQFEDAIAWWAGREASRDSMAALQSAFGVAESLVDETGEFRSDWVLRSYAHRGDELLRLMLPHLASLGLPGITDVLVGCNVLGWVLNCEDPISAYIDMDAFITFHLRVAPSVASKVRSHLEAAEPAMRRARRNADEAWRRAADVSEPDERRAYALASAYKSLVEGPFRQLSWARHCLLIGKWEAPPTLTSLRERLLTSSDNRDAAAAQVVIPEMRNSEAHETLAWNGIDNTYVTEAGDIALHRVLIAFLTADSVVNGCEAGLAAVRSLSVPADSLGVLPQPSDSGRMPAWLRVRAFFGTNRIRLIEANVNTRRPEFRVERLDLVDVNPCFQALVNAHRLLPEAEIFSVSAPTLAGPLVVSAQALAATGQVWEYAVSNLDQMPLSTFLPANLDSRRRTEEPRTAIRSAAWIAVDDAVDVIDGNRDVWDKEMRLLVDVRLRVVELALAGTFVDGNADNLRLKSVHASVQELRNWIATKSPHRATQAEVHPAMRRLRTQREKWGPVLRHPLLVELGPDAPPSERQPRLRQPPTSMAYRII